MFFAPILLRPTVAPGMDQFWVFLERNGTHLMEVADASEAAEFLEANDLQVVPGGEPQPHPAHPDVLVAFVDPTDKDLVNFYSWKEVVPGSAPAKEVWRPFLWVSSETDSDPWGVNGLLKEIPIGPNHSAYSLYSGVKTLRESTKTE